MATKAPIGKTLTLKAYAKLRGQPESIIRRKLTQAGLTGPIDPAVANPLLDAGESHQQKKRTPWATITAKGADVSYNEAERRLRLAQAEQQELKLSKLKGTLVLREAVEREAFAMGRRVRDSIENLPARLSGLFAAESDQGRIFILFSKEIQQCLESLTNTAPSSANDAPSDANTRESRAKPQRQTRRSKVRTA